MHYLIGLISATAMLIFALSRLQRAGLDLNALNPFLWYRRAQWRKLYGSKPLYSLDQPMDVAALLLLATAKCEGEVSAEQKKFLLQIFKQEFHLSDKEATALLASSAYLLRDELYIASQLEKVLARSKQAFTPEQAESTIELMQRLSWLDGEPNYEQAKLIDNTKQIFTLVVSAGGTWSKDTL
jgi:uncharacterized tellurite resistance protein B-like protein